MLSVDRRRQSTVRRFIAEPSLGIFIEAAFSKNFPYLNSFNLGIRFIINRVKNLVLGVVLFY